MNISCCKSYVGKEIIGLLPGGSSVPSECLWFFQPAGDVSGWTVSGESFSNDANINAILNPQGIYYSFYNTGEPGLSYYTMSFSYVGTEAPLYDLNILDSFSNPINPTWVEQCCTKTCYEIQIDGYWEDYQPQFFDFGFGNIFYNNTPYTIDNPIWESIFKSMFGSQTVLTYVLGNPWSFKIDNAYACAVPKVYTGLTSSFVDMVPCTPPAAVCAYYNQIIDNTSGCFSTGLYDFEGCGIDFNCLSSLYPNGYYVQDSSGAIFDFCSHLTVISNSTSQPAPINYLDFNGNPQTSNWTALCDYGCIQTNLFFVDNLIQEISFCGIDISMSSYGGDLDLYDIPTAETVLFGVFKTYFPSCTGVNIFFDGVKSLRITIFDIYYDSTSTLSVSTVQETKILGLFPC